MYLLYLLYNIIGSEFVTREARSAERATSELPITRIYCIYFICIYVCIYEYCMYILYLRMYICFWSIGNEFVARVARSAERATSELPITRIYCIYFICIYVCIYCMCILYFCMYIRFWNFGKRICCTRSAKREARSVLRVSFRLREFTVFTLFVFTYVYTVYIYCIFVCIYVFIYCIYVFIYLKYCTKLQMRAKLASKRLITKINIPYLQKSIIQTSSG